MGLLRHFYYPAFLLMIFDLTQGRIIQKPDNRLQASGWKDFPDKLYENVEVLILSNSNLHDLKPYVFSRHGFRNLNKALLRFNNIGAIHDNAFAKMSKIVQLDLHGNKLTRFNKNSFSGLVSLKHLHLGSNQIRSVDTDVLQPLQSLETLDLSHNSITIIERDLLKHTAIMELNLENNPLILEQGGSLLESATLTSLNLHYCNVENLPADVFSKLPKLEILDMSENQLKILPEGVFKQNVELKYLDISYNLLRDVKKEVLPVVLDELHCQGNFLEDGFDCNELLASSFETTSTDLETYVLYHRTVTTSEQQKIDSALPVLENGSSVSQSDDQLTHLHKNNDGDVDSSSTVNEDSRVNIVENKLHSTESIRNSNSDPVEKLMWGIVGILAICLVILSIVLFGIYYISKQSNNPTTHIYSQIIKV